MTQYSPDGAWRWDGTQWVPSQQPGPYAPPGYPPQPPPQTDGLAIASLVCGLTWMGGAGSVAAIVTGHMSRAKAKREQREGSGMALAGLILGYLGLLGIVAFLVFVFAFGTFIAGAINDSVAVDITLHSAAVAEDSYLADHGTYTDEAGLQAEGFRAKRNVLLTVVSHSETSFCLKAVSDIDTEYYDSRERTVTTLPCG